ncbi:nuclear transport factor 2 family protein [Rouxiella badensis]|uniref:nuclear transport factor 2 family protein n=1 Tax=Rouxiella badensis TaxID=1646377 RepID=UPI001B3E71FC|nr:nuclear transport factor 2 family protein [Rouxiella badensis]MCC3718605.1 nuclear transport factor 2 family protein [Rouxiella badensis]MCC3728056.1 nuclear transport factor 2 family protein [Rouxiella badensis]MCC3732776.1 nuclear transport factor 2 family protein [Rouxiella badensis]MCC3739800.1 nuclear transport factor 2 family protein [Rouxiella badensis]MCC3747157.1 nuclear transport factor 2 family protein [Rouxiella badensis]
MSDVLAAVEQQFYAYNQHDLEKFVSCFSETFIAYRMPATAPSMQGKQQLREFYAQNRFNNPALKAELISRSVLGNKVFDLETIHGLNEQPIESMAVFEVKDGLIETAWFYFA